MGMVVFDIITVLIVLLYTWNLESAIDEYIEEFKNKSIEMDDFTL
jgi:hypothetical protein